MTIIDGDVQKKIENSAKTSQRLQETAHGKWYVEVLISCFVFVHLLKGSLFN